jgi:uncharacterized protein
MANAVPEPRIDRALTLQFQGDWGQANLHRICGWLSQEVGDRCGEGTRIAIWSGRGGSDAIHAVARGQVDAALAVPACFVPMAVEGIGPFTGAAVKNLRALGTMPQTDRLVFAVKADRGISSFADLRAKKPALVISTSGDDGVNMIGFAAQRMLECAGIPRAMIESWGGRFVEAERPNACVAAVRDGTADAIIHEAVMTSYWHDLADAVPLNFLTVEPATLAEMQRRYRWPAATLPAGYFSGLGATLETLEFSDFLMVARAEMPDDLAYLIAWCMCERRDLIERAYRHIPPARSPVTYPLEPAKIARTPIELHPGARRYYRDAGVI